MKSTGKFQQGLWEYSVVILRLLLLFLLIRILEYGFFLFRNGQELTFELFLNRSLNYDALFVLLLSGILLPLHLLLREISPKALLLTKSLGLCLILFNLILTDFFLIGGFLMPSLVFEFSLNDLIHVASTELDQKNFSLWFGNMVLIILFVFVLFRKIKPPRNVKIKWGLISLYLAGLLTSFASTDFMYREQKHFASSFQYFLANSKPYHFWKSYQSWKSSLQDLESMNREELRKSFLGFQSLYKNRHFLSDNYPLLKVKKEESVLAPFFETNSRKPNIVLVISEGLSSSYSGTKTVYASLTPFTDSLRNESLYWENFLSNLDRSASAIPNLLGSLPFGNNHRGFINRVSIQDNRPQYPNHFNLVKYLKERDYQCNFYYGGWSGFDNIIHYTRYSGFDVIVDEESFGEDFHRSEHKTMSWGYSDAQLFERSFLEVDKIPEDRPFFHMYMTLSYHYPFIMADSIYFDRKFQDGILEKYGIDSTFRKDIREDEFGVLLYADQSLKKLFLHFKSRPDFENTLFIVVGDHGGGRFSRMKNFDKYRVPLIVYSPMLKKNAVFKGLCSQIDVLPSLLRLLESNFEFTSPAVEPFVGEGLDTSSVFTTNRFVPMNVLNYDRMNFILNNLVLQENEVFEFNESFEMKALQDEERKGKILSAYQHYLITNNYVTLKNKIWKEY